MFKLNEIKELIKLVDETSIHELELENEGSRLCIRKPGKTETVLVQPQLQQALPSAVPQPAAPQAPAQQQPSADTDAHTQGGADTAHLHKITSPMVGTFYESPSPGAAPFVKKGDKVRENTVVCIVEAMKLMNEIESEVKGEIVDILVENGQLVEYGQPLYLVKPE